MCTQRERKFKNIPIDEAIVWMRLSTHILSSLFIEETQQFMFFSYDKQIPTCNRCGSDCHLSKECDVYRTTAQKDRINATSFNLSEEKPDPKSNEPNDIIASSSDEEDEEEEEDKSKLSVSVISSSSVSDNDENVENNLTKADTEFPCSECDIKCKTVHELNEHREAHKMSYAKKAKSPPKQKVETIQKTNIEKSGFSASQPSSAPQKQRRSDNFLKKKGAQQSPSSASTRETKTHRIRSLGNAKKVWV